MMDFFTKVELPQAPFQIEYNDGIVLLGSCFSDEIGLKLYDYCFDIERNTFGSLYNPMSIAVSCHRMINPTPFTEDEIFLHDGLYHSFMHHSAFSRISAAECLFDINNALIKGAEKLLHGKILIITFGSAFIYRLKSNGLTVANCHKLPESHFLRERLTVNDITSEWARLMEELHEYNKLLKIIFTVSPVRHFRDGAHQNQVSKATLLIAIQELVEKFPDFVSYFPAYEIMMDELRDYRFYADDMIHPSEVAVQHIFDRFCATYMDLSVRTVMKDIDNINKALSHKPFNPSSDARYRFLAQTLQKIRNILHKYPYISRLAEHEQDIIEKMKNYALSDQ